ncbi:SH3 domain-containing protein [Leptospira yanagawae]|uniref:SH3 domain-containing protein n=1 Tax=Leptospira yanagawae TaxID=293069 RepID=A0ABY2M505_9LEPT|nr:SH3 domain-containing protein [Leptospira yanagawae]TGL24279.1 SH3 domain-containing protein [Leptospira yanagawae]
MKQCVTKSMFVLILLSLSFTNCLWKQIGNGYTTKSKIQVYSKPDDTSPILFEIPKNANFLILEKITKKDLKQSNDWWKIKKDNQVGYLKDQTRDSNLIFLNVSNPQFGLVAATSLFLRSEPNVESKAIEKLKTKDIVEILEESHSPISVNGKQGNWMKVKSKSQSIGYVFSPYIVIGDTEEILATLSDFETKESGWVYVKNKPSFVHQLYNKKLIKINNEQVEEDQFYFVKSRYVTKEGKVFFRVLKQKSRQEDWYSEIETTVLTDCYLPAESLVLSNQYASLYAKIRLLEPTEKKIFDFLSKEISYDIDPNQTSIKSFQSKKDRYFIVATTARDENDECIGCFLPELENIVYVLKEKANTFEIIFYESGSRSAIIDTYGISPKIIIRTSPLPEGDESPSKIYSKEYEFKGATFVLTKSETTE